MTGTREVSRRTRMMTDGGNPIAPILIQVPAIRVVPSRPVGGVVTKPRRRLRREVRYAGSLLMLIGMLAIGYQAGSRSSAVPNGSSREEFAGPSITLSIEPIAAIASRPNPEPVDIMFTPVELQSTLLPVDGSEDSAHEGH